MLTLGVIQVSPHLHRERPYPIFLQAKKRLTSINSHSYIERGRTGETLGRPHRRRSRGPRVACLSEKVRAATDVRFPGESQVGLDECEFSEIEKI